MRIIVIGATGTIGRAIVNALSDRHDVVKVGHHRGDHQVDLGQVESITNLCSAVGPVDAVVSAAGLARFGPLEELTEDDFLLGLSNKLMGQIRLVRLGIRAMRDNGSFTLTSGVLGRDPTPGSAAISIVNAGLEGFVRAAAVELPRGIRINAVSPGWVSETLVAMGKDPSSGMPAEQVARAYVASVEGKRSGAVLEL